VRILLYGMNHRTAPLEVRERFATDDPEPLLRKLVAGGQIEEAVLVSTCNRVEVVVTTHHPEAARHRLRRFFEFDLAGGFLPELERDLDDHLYLRRDREAICHVMRVASAIDSMVVGEPQILGQMKDAYREAVEAGTCGPVLSRLFQRAFSTAKRVRDETRISERPVSVARVAVELAKQIFERFDDKTALLVGAGEMIEAALFALQREGLEKKRVANRTRAHAESLARQFEASAHGLDELDDLLVTSDVVLTCIGGGSALLTRERVRKAVRARRNRPMFFIDMGVPRNVEPEVNRLDSVFLYDMDDLQEVAASNVEERRREAERAERIVVEEQERFDGWMVALQAVPTIKHVRARAEAIRERELDRMLRRMGLDDGQIEAVEQLTRAIVNKILHAPLARLRAETDREEGLAMLEAARALFALEDPKAPGADVDEELGFSPPSGSPSAKEQAPSARQQEPSVETEPSTESESSESLEDGE
jgi:glutamyl-tRNA reductase